MAAHMLCHGETMPSTFQAPRPTIHSHGMMSQYEAPVIMQQSTPYPLVENSLEVTFDEELPTFQPVPSSTSQNFDFSDFFDPALCITPEKSSFKQTKLANLKRGSDIGTAMRSQNSQKVRFENFVEVKEMTPEGIISAEAVAARTKASESLAREPIASGGDMFADHEPFDESETGSIPNVPVSKAQTFQKESRPETVEQFTGDSHVHSNGRNSNTEDDMEIVSILASDVNKLKLTKGKSKSDTQRHKKSHSSGTKQKRKDVPVDLTTLLPTDVEHDLARPEFNSTLRVGKELHLVATAELDVDAAVKQRLHNSRKTKESLKEKVSSRVNTSGTLYSGLVSVDVQEQELIGAAEKEKTARVKTLIPGKGVKPEDSLVTPPDILDCFTPNLIKETASYSLEGVPALRNEPTSASHIRAFDVFRHVRSWEGW